MAVATNRVLIIGGGISGLSLGQALSRSSIPFTIFERDASPQFRAQGYRLGHNAMGEEALKSVLSPDLYKAVRAMGAGEEDRGLSAAGVRADAITGENLGGPGGPVGGKPGTFALNSGPGKTSSTPGNAPVGGDPASVANPPKPGMPPSAPAGAGAGGGGGGGTGGPVRSFTSDRTVLRSMLGLNLESHISYGKRLTNFVSSDDKKTVTAHFEDGTSETGALLVGADGVRSKVYAQLLKSLDQPPPVILEMEMRCIYGKTVLTPEFEAVYPEKWRKGMSIFKDSTSPFKVLFMDPVIFNNRAEDMTGGKVKTPKNYLYWVFAASQEDFGMSDEELLRLNGEEAMKVSQRLTKNWHPDLRPLFDYQEPDQAAALRIVSASPKLAQYPSHPSITVMGDAVHPMSPAGGSGANTAIRDAALLGEMLKEAWSGNGDAWAPGSIAQVIEKYEKQMRQYAGEVLEKSFMGGKMIYGGKNPDEYKPVEA